MKLRVFIFIFLIASIDVFAQRAFDDIKKADWKERVYYGGGLGFNAGVTNGYKFIFFGLYPSVGYMITNNLSSGLSFNYQYYAYPELKLNYSQYGASPFIRYNFTRIFFAYSEFVLLNSPNFSIGSSRATYKRLLIGVGYSLSIGQRSALNVLGLYDLLYTSSDRVFGSPWVFRVNITF